MKFSRAARGSLAYRERRDVKSAQSAHAIVCNSCLHRITASYITPAMPVSIGSLTYSRGSVTAPVRALAATVRGLAR